MDLDNFMKRPVKKWNIKCKFWYVVYLIIAAWLPESRRLRFAGILRNYIARQVSDFISPSANIEKNSHFNPNVYIGERASIGVDCTLDGPVYIGDNVMMGPEVAIYTRNHGHSRKDIPMIDQGYEEYKPVVINEDCWIGRRVIILPGVTIEKGCILAAGAVVTKSVKEYSVVAGVPATIIGKR